MWKEWTGFLQVLGEEPSENNLRLLLLYYVARKMEEGASVAVINMQLAGLAFLFKLQGQRDVTKDFWVRQALKGYRKNRIVKDARRPVTFSILGRIVKKLREVCSSEYEVELFKAAFVMVFFWGIQDWRAGQSG